MLYATEFGGGPLRLTFPGSSRPIYTRQVFDALISQPRHYAVGRLEEEAALLYRTDELSSPTKARSWSWEVGLSVERRTETSDEFSALNLG